MSVILKFKDDVMDEFEAIGVIGFQDNQQWEEWQDIVKSIDVTDMELYVGTNEYCSYKDSIDYLSHFNIITVPEQTYIVLRNALSPDEGGSFEYGMIANIFEDAGEWDVNDECAQKLEHYEEKWGDE
jgi:hypothetical protein